MSDSRVIYLRGELTERRKRMFAPGDPLTAMPHKGRMTQFPDGGWEVVDHPSFEAGAVETVEVPDDATLARDQFGLRVILANPESGIVTDQTYPWWRVIKIVEVEVPWSRR